MQITLFEMSLPMEDINFKHLCTVMPRLFKYLEVLVCYSKGKPPRHGFLLLTKAAQPTSEQNGLQATEF